MLDPDAMLKALRSSIEILASAPDAQLAFLDGELRVGVDELAPNFADEAPFVPQLLALRLITPAAAAKIDSLDAILESFSSASGESEWSVDALKMSSSWRDIRRTAKQALEELSRAG